jgi:hypothetical protein
MRNLAAGLLVCAYWLPAPVAGVPFTPPDWIKNAPTFLPKGADRPTAARPSLTGEDFQAFRSTVGRWAGTVCGCGPGVGCPARRAERFCHVTVHKQGTGVHHACKIVGSCVGLTYMCFSPPLRSL